jgi:hypothetical protein
LSTVGDDQNEYDARSLEAIADADPYPYWYEDADEPLSNPTLVRTETCDLCIIGGGYTGLWTAIIAKERDPSRDVVLIDAHEIGSAASGRNGGFMDASLTHGIANGQHRFPDEITLLEELGIQNLNEIEKAIKRYDIDCDYERTGVIDVASDLHPTSYLDELRDDYQQLRTLGQKVTWLDREQMRAQVDSPTYTGGLWVHDRAALVDPARLAWGLKLLLSLSASASTRTAKPRPSNEMGSVCSSTLRSVGFAQARLHSRPMRSNRCSSDSTTTSCRCTTTAW